MAQQEGGNDGGGMNITHYGSFKSWIGTMDPLGKNTPVEQFNNTLNIDSADIGVFWWDARDIHSIEAVHKSPVQKPPVVQYWQYSWPEIPPQMPSKEDLEDDPWQGKWITAKTDLRISGNKLVFYFQPMGTAENAYANRLPGEVTYRRTLKVRLVYPGKHPALQSLAIYSPSKEKNSAIRIELLPDNKKSSVVDGTLEVFNGKLKSVAPWHWDGGDKKTGNASFKVNIESKLKGIVANITRSTGSLPGSNDETVVTFRSSSGVFSFSMADVDNGPVYIPYFHVYITKADDPANFSEKNVMRGKKIRDRIPEEPEQTYDRAKKEIPALDPTNRTSGGYIDLPLAADASWQKFAIQWGGNVLIDKVQSKAQGNEKLRCNWKGDAIKWDIGTGKVPDYYRTNENCQMSMMNDYLPVVQASWHAGGLNYREESFATLLRGPLSPDDPNRDEQTPALLMMKLTISNPGNNTDTSLLWMKGNDGISQLTFQGDFLMDEINGKKFIRGYLPSSNKTLIKDSAGNVRTVQRKLVIGPNSSQIFYHYFPFVGDLGESVQKEIAAMDFDDEKEKVVAYWRALADKAAVFNVPERKFNEMGRAIIPHIRISVTKDPKSGLYMVPAAALSYKVYPNESIFQTLLLDRLGDFKTSADYLNSFMALQGSSKLPGAFTGDQKDVFYGLKVDSMYDMTERNGYNMHHGTVLWGLARHYLYSNDREWLKKAAPHMIRAANWIIEQRANTRELDEKGNKETHYGLLPAGVLEDVHDWQHWYASNAYAYLGMESMAEAFRIAGMEEAGYYEKAAREYQNDIRVSMQRATELSPVIRLRNNTFVPYVPSRPHQRFRYFGTKKADYYNRYNKGIYPNLRLSAIREALYGPIVLLKAGLIDVDEPMADWVLDDWEDNLTISSSLNLNVHGRVEDEYWFSRGGMVFQANLQNPVGIYLLRQEIPATIRGLYDNFISCLYPDVNAHAEEYREWGKGSGPFYKCPDEARFISQVCDLLVVEKKNELWLAAGIPRRWLEAGERIELNKAFTEYGEVSYTMKQGELPETIEAVIRMPERKSNKVLLFVRAPFHKPIKRVVINGKESTDWDAKKEFVLIPQSDRNVKVIIYY